MGHKKSPANLSLLGRVLVVILRWKLVALDTSGLALAADALVDTRPGCSNARRMNPIELGIVALVKEIAVFILGHTASPFEVRQDCIPPAKFSNHRTQLLLRFRPQRFASDELKQRRVTSSWGATTKERDRWTLKK